jgi:predicted permease
MSGDDTTTAAVSRAKSYFLASAIVGNSLTFAIGPKLLDDEETPDEWYDQKQNKEHEHANGLVESDEEHANPVNCSGRTAEEQEEHVNEMTTLLLDRIARRREEISHEAYEELNKQWMKLPTSVRKSLEFAWSFLNAPLIGALIGAIIGLAPPLHKAFFIDPSQGGIFKAWLTVSVKNVGDLFAALQLVVVGAKLSGSILKMKKGEDSGQVKITPILSIFFIRFVFWPM